VKLVCVSPHCRAEIDGGGQCPDHPDEDVMPLHPLVAMGVARPPVFGTPEDWKRLGLVAADRRIA
jgi:hypothetical protein